MKWYLILFEYNDEWHMDVMVRDESYNQQNENDRLWFREATRFALTRQKLRKKDVNKIKEACLYEITCNSHPKDKSRIAEFRYPPVDSLHGIILLDDVSDTTDISNHADQD